MSGLLLENKVALLTGAAGGIGSACALAFARAGASLALVDRNASALGEVGRRAEAASPMGQGVPGDRPAIPGDRPAVLLLAADVTDARPVRGAVEQAIQRFGRIDVLVNLAG